MSRRFVQGQLIELTPRQAALEGEAFGVIIEAEDEHGLVRVEWSSHAGLKAWCLSNRLQLMEGTDA